MPTKKHRPYLSELTLKYLYEQCLKDRHTDEVAAAVFAEVAPFMLKLDLGKVSGSYITSDRTSLLNKLGGADTDEFDKMNNLTFDPHAEESEDDWYAAEEEAMKKYTKEDTPTV